MKNCNAPENQTTRRMLLVTCAAALAVALAVSVQQPAHAEHIVVPPVPANIEVDAGFKRFLVGHAIGTQDYVCLKAGAGVNYVLFTPQATLFDDENKQIVTHYGSPNRNPSDRNTSPAVMADGAIRVTWQDKDASTVWGKLHPGGLATVDPNAIPWLLIDVVGARVGPTGGDKLTPTKFIQRLNTKGGLAPSTGCSSLDDIGNEAFIAYEADYFFYR